MSFAVGGALVVLFMLVYYRGAGLLADLALLLNVVFILAALAALEATVTLPGIAGLVLTLGMAVDANVLINERIREELRLGKTVIDGSLRGPFARQAHTTAASVFLCLRNRDQPLRLQGLQQPAEIAGIEPKVCGGGQGRQRHRR